ISSAFALYFLAKLTRQHVKVVLSGDGGDEVFAGYVWRHADFPPVAGIAPLFGNKFGTSLRTVARSLLRRSGSARDDRYLRSFACFQREDFPALLRPDAAAPVLRGLEDSI